MKDFLTQECAPSVGVQIDALDELFALISAQQDAEERALEEDARQIASLLGHNGGPEISEPFGLKAPWFQHSNTDEVEELAKIHVWIERRQRAIADLVERRAKIRKRCIRRMRRAQGKN